MHEKAEKERKQMEQLEREEKIRARQSTVQNPVSWIENFFKIY